MTRFWRLNESLPEILKEVTRELTFYFQQNDNLDCDPGIVWEAQKAVTWGILIKHGSRIKRETERPLNLLLTKLHTVEAQHKHDPSPTLDIELASLHSQINDSLRYKAKAALQICCKISYGSGDKCRKILARSIREHKLQTYISHIISLSAQKTTLPTKISQVFRDFYTSLFNLPTASSSQALMDDYIKSFQIPTLLPEFCKELDAPIKLEEIEKAIGLPKPGKAPGPDSFTLQYYRTLLPILWPHMVDLFN